MNSTRETSALYGNAHRINAIAGSLQIKTYFSCSGSTSDGRTVVSVDQPLNLSLKRKPDNHDGETTVDVKKRKVDTLENRLISGHDLKAQEQVTGTKKFQSLSNIASNLKRHQLIHSDEKPYLCPYSACDKKFRHLTTLKSHLFIHSGKKPYPCPYPACDKKFRHLTTLKNHQNLHSGVKPYRCSGCDKTFTQPSDMKRHQLIHSGEKPHLCPDCGKKFRCSNNLKTHRLIHSGEKPHRCPVCDKAFNQSSNMKRHQRIHNR